MCSLKNPTFRGRVHKKSDIEGGLPKKGRLGQFADLRRGLGKKEGDGVFDGGLIPRCTIWINMHFKN